MRPVALVLLLAPLLATLALAKVPSGFGDMHRQDKRFLADRDNNLEGIKAEEIEESDEAVYFFTLHDRNSDSFLDGNELLATFKEDHEEGEESLPLAELVNWVDHVLTEDDKDGDGRISWDEYMASQQH